MFYGCITNLRLQNKSKYLNAFSKSILCGQFTSRWVQVSFRQYEQAIASTPSEKDSVYKHFLYITHCPCFYCGFKGLCSPIRPNVAFSPALERLKLIQLYWLPCSYPNIISRGQELPNIHLKHKASDHIQAAF